MSDFGIESDESGPVPGYLEDESCRADHVWRDTGFADLEDCAHCRLTRQMPLIDKADCQGEGTECYVHGEACRG